MKLNHMKDSREHNMRCGMPVWSVPCCSRSCHGVLVELRATEFHRVSEQDRKEAQDLIYQSAQATEKAWEEFHSAAIGGTSGFAHGSIRY